MYQINLSTYHGPLDLLLYLVKKNEVDILDIPISHIAKEFLSYLHIIQQIDIEWAGDFLLMAATLMEIKSKSLLPQQIQTEQEKAADPRQEIVRQLIQYRRTKEAANQLDELAQQQQYLLPRHEVIDQQQSNTIRIKPVEIWDLVSAFARLIRETQTNDIISIGIDDTPQATYQQIVKAAVAQHGRISLEQLIGIQRTRISLIGYFLAILELLKQGDVTLDQDEQFGMIWLNPHHMPRIATSED
jgi:segregation and condensation protein A